MKKLLQTPSQTVGPYFAYGLTPEQYLYDFKTISADSSTYPPDARLTAFTGRVFDGKGSLIPDAMIELWQNDGQRRYFSRCGTGTDPLNRFVFQIQKPLPVDGRAPFVTLIVMMRGQLIHSFTRAYFSDEPEWNEKDEVLNSVPASRRSTLIAQKDDLGYYFDIFMQGENETVFFEI